MLECILLFAIAVVLSYPGVGLLRRWAMKRRILDIPCERSSHTQATPRGGGLVIAVLVLGFFVATQIACSSLPVRIMLPIVAGCLILVAVSWWDDLYTVHVLVRLAAHCVAATICIYNLGAWTRVTLPLVGELKLGWTGIPLTFLWIVGLINAYNFMDGIDGIAGLQGVIGGGFWAFIGWSLSLHSISLMGSVIAGCSLGFLLHNWYPAQIFMGDVGSTFLGFIFAIMPLLAEFSGSPSTPSAASLPCLGVLLVWPFVFDTVFTIIRRVTNGENIAKAHRSHLYQRLIIAGHSVQSVSIGYGCLAIAGGIMSTEWLRGKWGGAVLAVPAILSGFIVGITYLSERAHRKGT